MGLIALGPETLAQSVAPAEPPKEAAKKTKQKVSSKSAKKDDAGKKDPAAAQQQLEAGVASLQAGKVDLAVQQLTAVVSGGGLSPAQMARAQYQRGLAYRKQSKPALAISDLTQALYIKNGLVEADRADALQNRSAAYRDAGLPDQDNGQPAKIAPVRTPPRVASAASAPEPVTSSPAVPAPVPAPVNRPTAGLAPSETQSTTTSSGGLGGFFSNLFGGSGAAAASEPAPTPPPRREPATSAWSADTAVKPAGVTEPPKPHRGKQDPYALKTQAAAPTSTGSIGQASTGGATFSIQVAQLKTRAEAEALAARVGQQFGADLAGRQASITAVSQGGFGTLHRVSFGPFASANDWKPLCPKLLSANLDCQPLKE